MRTNVRTVEREWLEARLSEGHSIVAIARQAGRSPSTVGYWLKRHELRANGADRFGPRAALDRHQLERLVAGGASISEMALELGCTVGLVRRHLARHGLTSRQSDNRDAARGAVATGALSVALRCRHHGTTDHVLEGRGSYRCKQCRGDRVAERRRAVKRVLVEEAGGCCVLCGYDRCEAALQFHHVDPHAKEFHLSRQGVTRSLERARAEAAKCVLLCATCHAEVEAGFSRLPLAAGRRTPRGGLEPPNLD